MRGGAAGKGASITYFVILVFALDFGGISHADTGGIPAGLRPDVVRRREIGIIEQDVKQWGLSEATRQNLTDLAELTPHGGPRVLHGRYVEDSRRHEFILVPDTASVQRELAQFDLDQNAIGLFSIIAAAQGNILQLEHDYSHSLVSLTSAGERRSSTQQELDARRMRFSEFISSEASIGAGALHKLIESIGEAKYLRIKSRLISSSIQKEKDNMQQIIENNAKSKATCVQGLANCTFPEGVADNCAGFLGMSVQQLKEKCPVIKKSSEK